MPRPHDDGARELVMPALFTRIEGDPDDAEHQRQHRNVVAEVPNDELPGAGLAAGLGVDDPCRNRNLAGGGLAVGPEKMMTAIADNSQLIRKSAGPCRKASEVK